MKELIVNASTKYSILINQAFSPCDFEKAVLPFINGDRIAIITDKNVAKYYGDILSKLFREKKIFVYAIKPKEKQKNIKSYYKILNLLADNEFSRNDTVIAFGGGVVGDIAGFVSATYSRGINFINVPTTLLAMVDSSVGGKTAINLKKGKNLCGAFYQPSLVYIALDLLKTLPDIEIKNGYGEIIKYHYLDSQNQAIDILDGVSEGLIYNCLKIKANIVEKDERETNDRKLLNFGHTFGHAIERASKLKEKHGIAVLYGIYYALKISSKLYRLDDSEITEYLSLLDKLNISLSFKYSIDKILKEIKSDKKRCGDTVDFVLFDGEKKARIQPIKLKDIGAYLQ